MSEVTKADIIEVHTRIDKMVSEQNKTNVSLAEIKTTLKLLPKIPDRPCHYHDELRADVAGHLDSHKEIRRLWQTPIVKTVIHLIEMAAVVTFTYLFVRKR